MARTPRDDNFIPHIAGTSYIDGTTTVPLKADPATGSLLISNDTPTSIEGSPVTIGTSAVELTFTGTTKSILIKAASANTGVIYIGKSNVDSSGNNALLELTADSAISIDFNDTSEAIYAVSDTASQKIYKMALV